MRVKVLLSTYNGAHFLGELLDSVFAQEDTDVEVVAVDEKAIRIRFMEYVITEPIDCMMIEGTPIA